ncbi:hypothetical protein ACFOPQ_15130 [Deinococcus antarcticus]|uniref:Uncharacterized protein n=1 Tax=Deinococcus antarcticus TaxID=1298767 RepID=A0ABV8A9E5_9DEIO
MPTVCQDFNSALFICRQDDWKSLLKRIDDYLKAAEYSGLFTLPNEPHQKASYAELITIALVGEWLGEASQGFWQVNADKLPSCD